MVVNTRTKNELATLLRFYKALNYKVEVTTKDWENYNDKTCIEIDLDREEIIIYSSINYFKAKGLPVVDYSTYVKDLFEYELEGFTIEIVTSMLIQQKNQGNKPSLEVFENNATASANGRGFDWDETVQGYDFWYDIIHSRDFSDFNFVKASRIK
jgi:hypothetical protein